MPHRSYRMLHIQWVSCHTYKGCDIIESVGVMTQIQWWLCYKYSECDVANNAYDVAIYSGWDPIKTVGVTSSIQWRWWHRYSGFDVNYSGCDVLKTVAWCHKVRMWCLVYCKRFHTYAECDIIQRVGVVLSIKWVCWHRLLSVMSHVWCIWCHTYWVWFHI